MKFTVLTHYYGQQTGADDYPTADEQATADLRAELASVLADWNDIVKAIGSPTNGGAIGHAKALRRERDEARATLDRCKAVNNATAEGWRETQAELDEARAELARLTTLRPASAWHDDYGFVLWWRLPIEEPPYCGAPLDDGWTGDYYSHWTPLPPAKEADK